MAGFEIIEARAGATRGTVDVDLIANGYGYMLSGQYWMSMFPGVALLAIVVAINLVGDRLRDTLDPRLKR